MRQQEPLTLKLRFLRCCFVHNVSRFLLQVTLLLTVPSTSTPTLCEVHSLVLTCSRISKPFEVFPEACWRYIFKCCNGHPLWLMFNALQTDSAAQRQLLVHHGRRSCTGSSCCGFKLQRRRNNPRPQN